MVSHVIVPRWLVHSSSDALVNVYLWRRAGPLCRECFKNTYGTLFFPRSLSLPLSISLSLSLSCEKAKILLNKTRNFYLYCHTTNLRSWHRRPTFKTGSFHLLGESCRLIKLNFNLILLHLDPTRDMQRVCVTRRW